MQDTNWNPISQRYYDPGGNDDLTTTVVLAVADATEVSPTELSYPPLYEVVDVPAIESVFFESDTGSASREVSGAVEFRYAGYLVTVRSDGWIQIYESRETEPSDGRR